MRTMVVTTFLAGVGLPLALAAFVGWRLLAQREAEGMTRGLTNYGAAVASRVEAHLTTHLDAVRALARGVEEVARFDAATMDQLLATTHEVFPGFRTMLAVDAEGNAFAGHPHTTREGAPIAFPLPVADRAYFQRPMADGRPFISPVFQGRGYGQHPIVAVSTPVRRGGKPIGVLEGSLDVARLPLVEGLAGEERFDVVVVDSAGSVVYATPRTGLTPLQPITALPAGRADRGAPGEPFGFTVGATRHVAVEVPVGTTGWKVIAQQPEAVAGAAARRFTFAMMATVLSGMALALFLGAVAAGRATRALERLEASVRRFLSGEAPEPIELAPQAPREMASLVAGYEEMQRRLGKTLSGLLPVCAWCKRIRDDGGSWSTMEAYVKAHSSAEITHGMCPDCATRFEASAAAAKAPRPVD